MTLRIIGIDPGKTGALCVLECYAGGTNPEVVALDRMPADEHALAAWMLQTVEAYPARGGSFAVVEKVSAGGVANAEGRRMGATSAFTFGAGFGVIRGVLAALEFPFSFISPRKWTGAMGERGKDKDSHWNHAKRLYPDVKIYKYAADAVLLAEYGRRNIGSL